MKKLLYTLMCCCTLISCTDLEPERYDAINPGFFPKTEKDAEALITGGVYAPFRCDNYSGIFNVATGVQIIGDMSTDLAVCCWVNDAWIPLTSHNWTPNHQYSTINYTNYAKYLGTRTFTRERISGVEMADNVKARLLKNDGTFVKKPASVTPVISQEVFMKEALKAERPVIPQKKPSLFKRIRKALR